MSEFAASALINRPVEEVWRFISDPLSAAVWGRGVSDVVITSSGPVGVGTTLGLRMSGSKMDARMIRYEVDRTFTLEFTSGPVGGSKLTYSVESIEGGTRLSTDLEMRLSGVWKIMYPILARRRIRDREWGVRNLKRILEAHSVPVRIEVTTLGEAWMAIAAAILTGGVAGSWEGMPIVEVFRATLDVNSPRVDDPIIARHGDAERLAWMHANFRDHSRVAELGDADSYATRLYDYAHAGRDQIRWVIDRLAANPWARDATITTFQPLTDTSYIPCVSLLDFWLIEGKLQLAVYAHSIDFGTKGYANLVELAALQARVAGDLGVGLGTLTMTVKSAHIYQTELGLMRRIIAAT